MKKLLALLFVLSSAVCANATITINLGGGTIYTSDPSTPAPVGSLLQLIVSTTDNLFTVPSPSSFTGGSADDIILASFAINQGPGVFTQNVNFSLSGNLGPSDLLLLRWYPTLTIASSSPGSGTPYGQFRTDAVENSSNIAWLVPADGTTNTLQFVTISQSGSQPNSAGVANLTVVPEPSSLALLSLAGTLGVVCYIRRRRAV